MKKQIVDIFYFLAPYIALFGLAFVIAVHSGEFTPINDVILAQSNAEHEIIFGRAYSNIDERFKWESVLIRAPRVLALGTSRVGAFRGFFFKEPEYFYNASRAIPNINYLRKFLDNIPISKTPQVIILGLDQHLFFRSYEDKHLDNYDFSIGKDNALADFLRFGFREIYIDYWQNKFYLKDVLFGQHDGAIGLAALTHHDGFRNDGSYAYNSETSDPEHSVKRDKAIQIAVDSITNTTCGWESADAIAPSALAYLNDFLRESKKRNIVVIGFFPPYAHRVYEKIYTTPNACAPLMVQLSSHVEKIFKLYSYDIYDFSDIASIGASDQEMIDSQHASEKTYLRLFIHMAQKNVVLHRYVDLDELKNNLSLSYGNFFVVH